MTKFLRRTSPRSVMSNVLRGVAAAFDVHGDLGRDRINEILGKTPDQMILEAFQQVDDAMRNVMYETPPTKMENESSS